MTVLLTGLWGSGKTMAARLLQDLGVQMDLAPGGDVAAMEDEEMHFALTYHPQTLPIDLIRRRDEAHPRWGFKHAALWNDVSPHTVHQVFRAPRVIVLHRDVVCLHAETHIAMRDIAEETTRALHWAGRLKCPVLHLSSELLFREPVEATNLLRGFVLGA